MASAVPNPFGCAYAIPWYRYGWGASLLLDHIRKYLALHTVYELNLLLWEHDGDVVRGLILTAGPFFGVLQHASI